MVFVLEYENMKAEAVSSLGSLYNSFCKRIDYTADKEPAQAWAAQWKEYREGADIDLNEIIEKMPDWMQYNFQHFANQQRFNREIERAFIEYEREISENYQLGFKRGRQSVQERHTQHLTPGQKEDLRLKTIFRANENWPELY